MCETVPNLPDCLRGIPDPPETLYYRGNWRPEIFDRGLAVVGTRQVSSYGERVVSYLICGLKGYEISIISGFSYGVDALAHEAALAAGLTTVAVLPCGIESAGLSDHPDLGDRIVAGGGLLLSEYEGSLSPQKWMFPRRNRIVAGLCRAALVIESQLGSGSLITAKYAHKYGRQVFSVPGNIFSENMQGNMELLGGYASPVSDPSQLLSYFGVKESDKCADKASGEALLGEGGKVVSWLKAESLRFDELVARSHIPAQKLSIILTSLEMSGHIRSGEGRFYVS